MSFFKHTLVVLSTVVFFVPILVSAQPFVSEPDYFVSEPSDSVRLANPLGDIDSFPKLIKAVLDAAFIIGLPIAVLFIVFAGLRFVWARGNESKLTSAKNNLLYTVIGIAVFFGAWTLATIIESTIAALKIGGV